GVLHGDPTAKKRETQRRSSALYLQSLLGSLRREAAHSPCCGSEKCCDNAERSGVCTPEEREATAEEGAWNGRRRGGKIKGENRGVRARSEKERRRSKTEEDGDGEMRRCGDAEKRANEKSGRPRLAARKRRRGSPAWTADLSPRTRSKARRNFLQFKTKKNGGNGGKGGKRFSGDPPVPASSHFGRRGEEVTLLKRMPRHLGEAAGEEGYAAFLEKKTTKFPRDSSTRQRGRQPCQEEVERRESKKRSAGNEPPRQPERRQRRNKQRKRSRKKEAEKKKQRKKIRETEKDVEEKRKGRKKRMPGRVSSWMSRVTFFPASEETAERVKKRKQEKSLG
ncbi:hypothetical protein TGFOU_363460, partial [Toxoplasma gondii FOU]